MNKKEKEKGKQITHGELLDLQNQIHDARAKLAGLEGQMRKQRAMRGWPKVIPND